jgi:hypothetical protein
LIIKLLKIIIFLCNQSRFKNLAKIGFTKIWWKFAVISWINLFFKRYTIWYNIFIFGFIIIFVMMIELRLDSHLLIQIIFWFMNYKIVWWELIEILKWLKLVSIWIICGYCTLYSLFFQYFLFHFISRKSLNFIVWWFVCWNFKRILCLLSFLVNVSSD